MGWLLRTIPAFLVLALGLVAATTVLPCALPSRERVPSVCVLSGREVVESPKDEFRPDLEYTLHRSDGDARVHATVNEYASSTRAAAVSAANAAGIPESIPCWYDLRVHRAELANGWEWPALFWLFWSVSLALSISLLWVARNLLAAIGEHAKTRAPRTAPLANGAPLEVRASRGRTLAHRLARERVWKIGGQWWRRVWASWACVSVLMITAGLPAIPANGLLTLAGMLLDSALVWAVIGLWLAPTRGPRVEISRDAIPPGESAELLVKVPWPSMPVDYHVTLVARVVPEEQASLTDRRGEADDRSSVVHSVDLVQEYVAGVPDLARDRRERSRTLRSRLTVPREARPFFWPSGPVPPVRWAIEVAHKTSRSVHTFTLGVASSKLSAPDGSPDPASPGPTPSAGPYRSAPIMEPPVISHVAKTPPKSRSRWVPVLLLAPVVYGALRVVGVRFPDPPTLVSLEDAPRRSSDDSDGPDF
jgi:hypothetical protein